MLSEEEYRFFTDENVHKYLDEYIPTYATAYQVLKENKKEYADDLDFIETMCAGYISAEAE